MKPHYRSGAAVLGLSDHRHSHRHRIPACLADRPERPRRHFPYLRRLLDGTGAALSINPATAYSLKVRNYVGPTDLEVDVAGYYVRPMAGLIRSDGTTYDGTNRVINSGRLAAGQYWVQLDRNIAYCQVVVTAYNVSAYGRADTFADPVDTRVRVNLYNSVGTLTDSWFYFLVSC